MPSPLFIISGPSGAGEDSIISGLESHLPIERVITTTTRTPRTGESEGKPYYFLPKEAFETGIQENRFLEYARQYNDNLYGVTFDEINRVRNSGRVGIWKIEWKGVITAKKLFPDIIAILVTVPSLSVLEARIRRRDPNVSEEYLKERMDYTREWLRHTGIYDYTVVNKEGELDHAIQETEDIIRKHWQQKIETPR